jgi:hypothetical protein
MEVSRKVDYLAGREPEMPLVRSPATGPPESKPRSDAVAATGRFITAIRVAPPAGTFWGTRMNILSTRASIPAFVALCALAGCASAPPADVVKRAADINVYAMPQLTDKPYDVVNHIWVDNWRTAFAAPTYPSEDEALAALRLEAARAGADGLINVVCLDQDRPKREASAKPAILCYGNAVRLRGSAG